MEDNDKLKEALIRYREAVPTSSPGLPPRLPWGDEFQSASTPMGLRPFHVLYPNVAAERQRWAGGHYRFAV